MQKKLYRNKSDFCLNEKKLHQFYSKKPTYITLSDFMRIQNEINPVNAELENRIAYNEHLKLLSQNKSKNWPDSLEMKKKNKFEQSKKRFLAEEERRRLIDIEEKKYADIKNSITIEKAKNSLFYEQDPVKTFNSKLMYCDMLKERDYQSDIKNRKKEINDIIEKQFFDMNKKKWEDYDQKEREKEMQEQLKKQQRMKIINDQLHESKIKLIQDYQEKMVEGQIMKLNIQKAIEADKKELERKKQLHEQQKKEYILANERLQKYRNEQKLKELEEEKKIQEHALKKQQMEDLRKKVEADKKKEQEKNREKMEKAQLEYFNNLQKKNNEILERDIKKADDKKLEEENLRKKKQEKMLKDIKEQMEQMKIQKENEKLKRKEEDLQYIDDFKRKLKMLEDIEKNEQMERRKRNIDLAEYQKLQYEEKKKRAMDDFIRLNEDTYKNLKRLEIEDDDFIKYAEKWIHEYKQQGKNIIPLLLELKRYKRDYSLK